MSDAARPAMRARFRIGPWIPGVVLPIAVGVLGILASLLVLQELLLAVGVLLSAVAALRVRTAAPWLLVALLAVGRLVGDPTGLDPGLPAFLLALHVLVVLVLLARVVPARSRLQLAALGPTALTTGAVQVVAQALSALLLGARGQLQVLPAASMIGGALLVLVAGLLVVMRQAGREE